MERRPQPSSLVVWALAALVPFLAGAGAWFLSDATISRQSCVGGEGGSQVAGLAVFVVLVLAGPATTAWIGRRRPGRSAVPAVMSLLISPITVYVGAQLWWAGHGCMT